MLNFLINFSLFGGVVLVSPFVILTFFVLKVYKALWMNVLSMLHPNVEFIKYDTVRSLLDTHRNQGIVCVLLSIKGQAQPEAVRRHLQEVVRRRDKTGNLAFLRLRHCLVTKCGSYGWQNSKFNLDQHLTVVPFTYKGRAVTEYNIQDYVNEIVSKYMPGNISPWQITIIPSSEDQHYILFRLHHILLSEGLNIGDLLPLIPPTRPPVGSYVSRSPLVEVFKKPEVILVLKDRLTEELSNRWNEFVANNDPLERPELLKSTPTFFQFVSYCLLSFVSVIRDCRKGFRVIKPDAFSRFKYVVQSVLKETDKRQIGPKTLCLSVFKSLDPRNLLTNLVQFLFYILLKVPIRLPIALFAECRAFCTCLTLNYCPYPRTTVGILYTFIPLFYNSLKEFAYIATILFKAPKTIIQDILLQDESFETFTLCGRKSVAWSDPIKTETIKAVAKQAGVSETEIMLSAVSMCLSKYFVQTNHYIPTKLPITIRNISSNYIFSTGPNIRPEDAVSGILCLSLTVPDPKKGTTEIENLLEIRNKFNASLENQGLSHLLTMLQTKFRFLSKFLPATLLSIYLKYLSRKYAVSVAEITSRYPNVTQRTIWGQEVSSVIYLRPPQANTCISLCLNEYSDHVKLGLMCDSQLVPYHTYLVRNFSENIQNLGEAIKEGIGIE
ncbi:uncharacterized protein LOC114340511 isoform X2 [Diabrotica virgifera virgifera]|uniref:O-acyltransferase WSD1 C-terminal domain-containing protein n=1 Tax=Diabrotica virgifera virgifera TaxID=50390 RepID=A0ABM5IXH2_DIAVI|nr:uncharacterized protein LOC114340511 isoform X1 [Diabrotica virgifera virgifera]XP_028147061.2 uncharacterized protein LOC114340511 isoform X2 [Diabrotica virgifera virgifera]